MPSVIAVYEALKIKLGENEARELIEYIEEVTDKDVLKKEIKSELKNELVTKEEFKEEIYKLKEEIYKLRMDTMKMFYLMIIILIILNGDKIINFLRYLIK
ncbi:MAG TPA: hypothetical protein EYP22_09360 [Methanosarcinales archaeon]|nr:hypothetical protein [Methanosarcinales archaeon]